MILIINNFFLQIMYLKKPPNEAYDILTSGETPAYIKFRDASNMTPLFEISLKDCLKAIDKAKKYNFVDFTDFNVMEYEYYEVSLWAELYAQLNFDCFNEVYYNALSIWYFISFFLFLFFFETSIDSWTLKI